jgi:hypothetical protein
VQALLGAMESIAATTALGAAAEWLRITKTDLRRLSYSLRKLGQFFSGGKARVRRSPKPQPRYTPPCEIAACQVAQSSTPWNRVELYAEVWDQPLVKFSRKYGISDVRLGKVCRKLKIPHPGRGYWAKKAVGQTVEGIPLPAFKDAPVVKRLIRESKPEKQRGGKIVRQKRSLRKSLSKQFRKNRLGQGVESLSPFVRLAQPIETNPMEFGCGGSQPSERSFSSLLRQAVSCSRPDN